ncbi:flavin reductase family protein [Acinetobacter gerneri]|uniref:flavin reductase family protein n=1 Tax=Acinetobacter gerneri TaxID=202952 RepID=UPI0029366492|nr:flavin reductase family protein [Acinetobacter gerneri]MDV2438902.1 flavin reductase family protein [Acinetobacter gerneri]
MNINLKDFRNALSKFPTGVTIITTYDKNKQMIGVTASSFNSVSLEPALVLWSIHRNAYSYEAFTQGEYFTIHVLNSEQVELSNKFARRGEDKFKQTDLHENSDLAPRLTNVAAWFECKKWNIHEAGDHAILIGEVLAYGYDDQADSLVFCNGSYAIHDKHPLVMVN